MDVAKRQITNDDICMLQTRPRANLFVACYHKANGLLSLRTVRPFGKCLVDHWILNSGKMPFRSSWGPFAKFPRGLSCV